MFDEMSKREIDISFKFLLGIRAGYWRYFTFCVEHRREGIVGGTSVQESWHQ